MCQMRSTCVYTVRMWLWLTLALCLLAQISYVVMALKSGSRGTQACSEAISTIMGIVGDLETTAMFAAAGALYADAAGAGAGKSFAEHREKILKEAKVCLGSKIETCTVRLCQLSVLLFVQVLVEDTKLLVSAAGGSQEQLAGAAEKSVRTIANEAEYIKLGAGSLGADDIEAQVG